MVLNKTFIRDGFPKKSSCSFGFCPSEWEGRALPKFLVHFSQTVYIDWVNFGMGREGETPAQIFWHICVQNKTISDGGITVDFLIIKVHTFN